MKKTDYTINYKKSLITISADFAERAGKVNSNEYKAFRQLQKDYPDFTIKYAPRVKADKITHKGLTLPFMERFIESHRDCDMFLKEFIEMKKLYKEHPAYYATIKKWFLKQFPEMTAKAKDMRITVLTLEFIKDYIYNHDNCNKFIPKYEKIKVLYESSSDYAPKMKQWFIEEFPGLTAEEIKMEIDAEKAAFNLNDEYKKAKSIENKSDKLPNKNDIVEDELKEAM